MKNVLFVLLIVGLVFVGCSKAEARGGRDRDLCDTHFKSILNECVAHPTTDDDDREAFDIGAYLHLILWEADDRNWEIGNWNTYEVQRNEFTTLFGIKIYLNRLTYQKP